MHGTELGGFSARPQEAQVVGLPFPLTPAQLGVWYAQLLDPDVPITIAQYVDIDGELDIAVLQQVSAEAAHAYGSSLVRIGEFDGVPHQYVDHTIAVEQELPLIDLRHHDDPVAAAQEWMRAEFGAPIDLFTDRLVAGAVLRVGEARWFWYLRGHHIVLDGYGAFTNSQRVAELYTARMLDIPAREVVPGELSALVEGEQRYRESTGFLGDREHWAQRIAGLDSPPRLDGRTAPRSAINLVTGGRLSEKLVDRLETIAASDDSAISAVLLAAFAAYLGRLHRPPGRGAEPARHRPHHRGHAPLGGELSNIVPLRLPTGAAVRPLPGVSCCGRRGWRWRCAAPSALPCRGHPPRRRGRRPPRPACAVRSPLANFMLFRSDLTLGTTTGRYRVLSTGPIEDLSLNVYYGDRDRVHVDFEANPHLYDADTLARHHARFLGFLERLAAADLDTALSAIEVATELELQVSTRIWNSTRFDVDAALAERSVPAATLPALFEAQVARTPDDVAVRMATSSPTEGATLTYASSPSGSTSLSRWLRAAVSARKPSGTRHAPFVDLVVGMYAVIVAGGAYVPLDPDHPAERTEYILATADPVCVLTSGTDRRSTPRRSGSTCSIWTATPTPASPRPSGSCRCVRRTRRM